MILRDEEAVGSNPAAPTKVGSEKSNQTATAAHIQSEGGGMRTQPEVMGLIAAVAGSDIIKHRATQTGLERQSLNPAARTPGDLRIWNHAEPTIISRTVTTLYTASPNIEQTRWVSEQEQIVVKSRGNHGSATVQLFNSRAGRQECTVMAYELASGGPTRAAGMAD